MMTSTSGCEKECGTATSDVIGAISELWRFPVKSMQGERATSLEIDEAGVVGDRTFAIVDVTTGKVASAKHIASWPGLLDCRAESYEPADGEASTVWIGLPDGTDAMSDRDDVDAVLSSFFGRSVRLARAAPEDFTVDQYHPDLDGLDPEGHRNVVTVTRLGAALFTQLRLPSPLPPGSFLDLFPVTVVTTSTLAALHNLRPASRFDARRFRMNLIVGTDEPGLIENDWAGRQLEIGDDVQLRIAIPAMRCVMPTVAQGDLAEDRDILRTLVRHNRLSIPGAGLFPCAGVYATVESTGTVRAGDTVRRL
jgi:MOSC domain-containing protein